MNNSSGDTEQNNGVDDASEKNDETCTFDIDDFELPPIEHVLTLNEILSQDDNENDLDFSLEFNEVVLTNGQQNDALLFDDRSDITSVSASTSTTSTARKSSRANARTRYNAKSHASKADILRRVKLRAISNQIVCAKEQVNAGSPTAIAVCEKYIGVGTSHGLVLVFGGVDTQQVLKCCLGSSSSAYESGGVAALDFNYSGTRLLIGYANGWVHLYDIQTAKLIQRLSDAHPPGYSVLHLKFCTVDGGTAALNDSGGSVFELTFGRLTRSSSGRCMFSGSRGEVCNIAPLLIPPIYKKQCAHYANPILLAMASLTKVIVVRLVPSTRVVFAFPLPGRPESPPLLCWQFTQVQLTERNRIVDPVLTFARDNIIYSYQLHTSDGEKFRAFAMHKVDFRPQLIVSSSSMSQPMMIHMQWLNFRYLLVLDSCERLHLCEPGCGDGEWNVETADLSYTKLVYDGSTFKAIVAGGNVSKALACVASKICYHSLIVLNNQAFLLGSDAVYSIVMRTWLERVDGLVQLNDYPGAMQLILGFYTGKKKLGSGINTQKGGAEKWKPIVMDKGVHLLLDYVDHAMTSKEPNAPEKIVDLGDHFKIVIPVCIDSCLALGREDVLYDPIYSRISCDQTAKGIFLECLDDYIADNLLTNLPPVVAQDYFYHLEKEGLYGSIECSVVRLPVTCLDLHQVMTLCRKHNLYDGIIYVFNQALQDFLTPLKEMINSLVRVTMERDLLTDEDIRLGNKLLLYISCCLSGQMYPVGNLELADARRVAIEVCDFVCTRESGETGESSLKYPYLRSLLKFDCREFLNVLSMAFGSHYLDIDEQQRTIDILVQVMLDDADWMPFQTGALFTFIMRQVVMTSGDIGVTRDNFRQLLKVVFQGKLDSIGTCSFEERQQALIEFLHWSKSGDLVDEDEVLSLAEKAQYFQVCEILYSRRRQFGRIIECYTKDAYRKEQIFDYVFELCSNMELNDDEKKDIRAAFLNGLSVIGGFNPQRCADVLMRFFPDSVTTACEKLHEEDAPFLVPLLNALLEMRSSAGLIGFVDDNSNDPKLARIFCQRLCEGKDADNLLEILISHDELCTEDTLEICRKYRATGPLAYMLERKGKYEEAFLAIYEDIADASQHLDRANFESLILFASEFLRNKCHRFSKDQLKELWFKLLLMLMNLSVEEKTSEAGIKAAIVKLVHEMIHFVNPLEVLPKLLDHPLFQGGSYSEFQDLINGILNGYSYDEVLLSKFVSSIYGEIHNASVRLRTLSVSGCRANVTICSACNQSLPSASCRNVVVFGCSHSFHSDCLRQQGSFFVSPHGVQEWLCSVCNKRTSITKLIPSQSNNLIARESTKTEDDKNLKTIQAKSFSKFEALQELEARNTARHRNTNTQSYLEASLNLAPPRI